jgi:hypothetical protein
LPGKSKNVPTFAKFVRTRQVGQVNWRQLYDNAKETASLSKLVRFGIELLENLLKIGKFSPNALLQDEGSFATEIARRYLALLIQSGPAIFVIRDSQNIDPESLGFYLAKASHCNNTSLILEYTTEDGFTTEHEKVITDTIPDGVDVAIWDLHELEKNELRTLLRLYFPERQQLYGEVESRWTGNLRILREYRLLTQGGNHEWSPQLPEALSANLARLSNRQKAIIAIVAVHVEPLSFDTLLGVIRRIEGEIEPSQLRRSVRDLEKIEQYLVVDTQIRLSDEDVADAVINSRSMSASVTLAQVRLRDYYLDAIEGFGAGGSSIHLIMRQAIALCARTGDVIALRKLLNVLQANARGATDQTLYVNLIAAYLLSDPSATVENDMGILRWTAEAAYEVEDFATCAALLETISEPGRYEKAILASCYTETNRHAAALELTKTFVDSTRGVSITDVAAIIGTLIRVSAYYALGAKEQSARTYFKLRYESALWSSPLFGFILRFREIAEDFPGCFEDVLLSAKVFDQHQMVKSAAYSRLSSAVHLAYSGNLRRARKELSKAEKALSGEIKDRHILLNNSVVVELLRPSPQLARCIIDLNSGLITVRDEFSRLTLHNNRLIAYWLSGDNGGAWQSIRVIETVLGNPNFGNRDIFWTALFNVCGFLRENDEPEYCNRFTDMVARNEQRREPCCS